MLGVGRRPYSVALGTALIACVVLGIELAMMLYYTRVYTTVQVKRLVLKLFKDTLEYYDSGIPVDGGERYVQELLDRYDTVCANQQGSTEVLVTVGYVLATALALALLFSRRTVLIPSDWWTMAAAGVGGLVLPLISQYAFLKVVVSPQFVDMARRYTGADIDGTRGDPPWVTATLLMPTVTAIMVLAMLAIWKGHKVVWPVVGMSVALSVFSVLTEVVVGFFFYSYNFPVSEIKRAVKNAGVALMWTSSERNEEAVQKLTDCLLPYGTEATTGQIFLNIWPHYFDVRCLRVRSDKLEIERCPGPDRAAFAIMSTCCLILIFGPIVYAGVTAPMADAAVLIGQISALVASYVVFVFFAAETGSMQELMAVLSEGDSLDLGDIGLEPDDE